MKAISEFILILPLGFHLKSSQSYFSICIPRDAAGIAKYAWWSLHTAGCMCLYCSLRQEVPASPPPPPELGYASVYNDR